MVRIVNVSAFNVAGAVKHLVSCAGLSTDTKPTDGIVTGSDFTEVDTGDVYFFDEESDWVKQFSFQA